MKNQHLAAIGVSTYILAFLIITHWICICSFDEFLHLYKNGFTRQTIDTLPFFLKPLYKGTPNLITLISYVLFTFSAFFLIGQKRKTYFYMGISSFILLAYLFLFLAKA
jgi:hypothetical protein